MTISSLSGLLNVTTRKFGFIMIASTLADRRAVSTNILHFPARVLAIAGGKEPRSDSDFDLDTVLPCT